MTKKDYILIANALKPFYQDMKQITGTTDEYTLTKVIIAISKALKADNPKFNPVKFLDYLRSTKAPKTIEYHPQARYIDCKLVGHDYCDKCGWTK